MIIQLDNPAIFGASPGTRVLTHSQYPELVTGKNETCELFTMNGQLTGPVIWFHNQEPMLSVANCK